MKNCIIVFVFVVVPIFIVATSQAQDITTGLESYYKLDGDALDSSGNGNDGSVSGAAFTSDRFGGSQMAAIFDGVDDYIDPVYDVTDITSYSVCAWANTDQLNSTQAHQFIFGGTSGSGATTSLSHIYIENQDVPNLFYQQLGLSGGPRPTIDTGLNIIDGEWHLICVTSGTAEVRLYLDADIVGVVAQTTSGGLTGRAFIGANNGKTTKSAFFTGTIDDVRIYNRELTPIDVLALYDVDTDGDGIADNIDNCPLTPNPGQEDLDGDLLGDLCDDDLDGDGVDNVADAFPSDPSESSDNDNDGTGDNADLDDDNDGFTDLDELACGSDPLTVSSVPVGTVSGTVLGTDTAGIAGVIVKLLDELNPTIVIAEDTTDISGTYTFPPDAATSYVVMVVEPIGYLINQQDVLFTPTLPAFCSTPDGPDFIMTKTVFVNNAESRSYWKHQFDKNGEAEETLADLQSWIADVETRYTNAYYQTLFNGLNGDFALWTDVLGAKSESGGTAKKLAKAKSEIASLVLNVVSLKLGQYDIASVDGHDVADVITYASQLVIDPAGTRPDLSEKDAYALAENLAKDVNKQKQIEAGEIPACSSGLFDCDRLYKNGGDDPAVAVVFSLGAAYPNPFNGSAIISYTIGEESHVRLAVYDVLGREVIRLVDEKKSAGKYSVSISSENLPSGLYIYRLDTIDGVQSKKMTVLR